MYHSNKMEPRKHLSADPLFRRVRNGFEKIEDPNSSDVDIPLADVLMSAFAMFSLKDPSLLAFDNRRKKDHNLGTIYHIDRIPSDTQMRTRADEVDPDEIRPIFKDIFGQLQRGKVLEKMVFMNGCYLLPLDGTGYFSSKKVHCPSCLERKNKKSGEITYHHQMLAAAIVHPDMKEVIPLAPEPIIKQDGETKNDCERNAAKRFLKQFRKDHPHLPVIITEDGLSSNAPHIRELEKYGCHYILGIKEGDHPFLFEQVKKAYHEKKTTTYEIKMDGVTHIFHFINQIPLNASNQDLLVNFLEYWEVKDGVQTQYFSWVTDFTLVKENVYKIMRGGRARWKIENETINTVKNQGYHFEHNYGHGKKNLSVVFAYIMMLAFLVDQTQQLSCALFQAVLKKEGTRKSLWEHMRNLFYSLEFDSMASIFKALLNGYKVEGLIIFENP